MGAYLGQVGPDTELDSKVGSTSRHTPSTYWLYRLVVGGYRCDLFCGQTHVFMLTDFRFSGKTALIHTNAYLDHFGSPRVYDKAVHAA